jgi:hypothetical protein
MASEPYYVNATGTLERHKQFVSEIMSQGPYQPDTEPHLKSISRHHVKCPDGTIRFFASLEDAIDYCFKLNLAFLKGQESVAALEHVGEEDV